MVLDRAASLLRMYRPKPFRLLQGTRVDDYPHRFVETNLLSTAVQDYVKSRGVVFADPADAAGCIIKIASDAQINGKMLFSVECVFQNADRLQVVASRSYHETISPLMDTMTWRLTTLNQDLRQKNYKRSC